MQEVRYTTTITSCLFWFLGAWLWRSNLGEEESEFRTAFLWLSSFLCAGMGLITLWDLVSDELRLNEHQGIWELASIASALSTLAVVHTWFLLPRRDYDQIYVLWLLLLVMFIYFTAIAILTAFKATTFFKRNIPATATYVAILMISIGFAFRFAVILIR